MTWAAVVAYRGKILPLRDREGVILSGNNCDGYQAARRHSIWLGRCCRRSGAL